MREFSATGVVHECAIHPGQRPVPGGAAAPLVCTRPGLHRSDRWVFALLPILWGVSTSFKSIKDVNAFPSQWIPETVTYTNWNLAVLSDRYGTYLLNTLIVIAFAL